MFAMARPDLHSADAILDAARGLVLERGAGAATIGAIARASGAPVGSIYHRFGSRDDMFARAWTRAARRAQRPFLAALDGAGDPRDAAAAAALSVFDFARAEPADSRLLVALRLSDISATPRAPEVVRELRELNLPVQDALVHLARRLFGRADRAAVQRTALACVDLALGAVRHHLVDGEVPPRSLRAPLERAVRASLEPARSR
jgi:AcrR family transcriptional regulator